MAFIQEDGPCQPSLMLKVPLFLGGLNQPWIPGPPELGPQACTPHLPTLLWVWGTFKPDFLWGHFMCLP